MMEYPGLVEKVKELLCVKENWAKWETQKILLNCLQNSSVFFYTHSIYPTVGAKKINFILSQVYYMKLF